MAINIQKFLPPPKSGAIVKAQTAKISVRKLSTSNRINSEQTNDEDLLKSSLNDIRLKLIDIKKILRNTLSIQRGKAKIQRRTLEREKFEEREKKLEKKNNKKKDNKKIPSLPKTGIFDWINNFLLNTFIGFVAIRIIDFLPKIKDFVKLIGPVVDFFFKLGGGLLNGLITLIDWGYKAADATRGFIKNLGGEDLAKNFDKFTGTLTNFINLAVIAGMLAADSAMSNRRARPRGGGRRGFDRYGRRVGKEAQRRYIERYGRDQFLKRFGKKNLENVGKNVARSGATKLARNALVGVAGKGGAKAALRLAKPIMGRIPIIGGLLEFALSWALGDPVGKAAFRGIGAVLVGAVGTAIGGPIGAAVGGFVGGEAGGVLYDMIFGNKNPDPSKPTKGRGTNKAAGGGSPVTRGGKNIGSGAKRSIKKQKVTRQIKSSPTPLSPGSSIGGEKKIKELFAETKDTSKPSPYNAIKDVYNIYSKDSGLGALIALSIKPLMGDSLSASDYKSAGVGISNWMNNIISSGTLGYAEGGQVIRINDIVSGKDYSDMAAKSVEESLSKYTEETLSVIRKQLNLKKREDKLRLEAKEIEKRSALGMGYGPGAMGSGSISTLAGSGGGSLKDLTDKDFEELAFIVSAEAARGTDDEYGVAAAILNRVSDPRFPSTIKGVGAAPGQFEAVYTGKAKYDPALAKKLKQNQGKIVEALNKLQGRTDFKGQSQLANKGSTDIMFDSRGNFYHYSQQKGKNDPVPKNIPTHWKKLLGPSTGGSFSSPSDGGMITAGGGTIVEIGKNLVSKGFQVAEHPDFTKFKGHTPGRGSVSSVHRGRGHYEGRAIDVTDFRGTLEDSKSRYRSVLNSLYKNKKQQNIGMLIHDSWGAMYGGGSKQPPGGHGHPTHMHIETRSKFHGGIGQATNNGMMLKLHEGEMFKVIDKDSRYLFGDDLVQDIINIENATQLKASVPTIIEKLKSISGYTDYERPMGEVIIVDNSEEEGDYNTQEQSPYIMGGGDPDNGFDDFVFSSLEA